MQVANTLNNTIRILFNPKVEAFKLFDFLVVKSDDSKYVAQIIEIYDDKFDASQNVAKIKLFFQINQNNEVMPYDNFTPNKECEIIKVKQEEIEDFINQDKETFIFGTNVKSSTALKLQYDFFENNAVVLADKIENASSVTFNLAKNLSTQKNVVIIDQTGVLEYEHAKKIKAGKHFRMPLNYSTIDHVFNRCLSDASLEFQAIGGEIINEIKRFARKQEGEFIPFNHLTRVLIQQYKATPYPELKLLLVRLKKYQMNEIFAKTKNDKENLFKTIEKNPITIIDLSEVEPFWQKAYLEYITSDIEQQIYLLARINDEHFDSDLINKIYCKKKNIKFVPNVSYNYKRLPSVMQYCKNHILMPSLFQRADFLDANFALSNLISNGCIIFGKNTDNFIYLACDYELDVQEKRKNYKKIALTLAQQDQETERKLGNKGDYFEEQNKISDSQKLIQELSNLRTAQNENDQNKEEYVLTNAPDEDFSGAENIESFNEIENPTRENINADMRKFKDEENSSRELEIKIDAEDEFQELKSEVKENNENDEVFKDILDETQDVEKVEILEEIKAENEVPIIQENSQEQAEQKLQEVSLETQEEEIQEEQIDITDEELDFFQMAQESADEYEEEVQEQPSEIVITKEEIAQETLEAQEEPEQEIVIEQEEAQEEIDLNEIADKSLDNSFEQIINTKVQQTSQTISIDDNKEIDAEVLVNPSQKENLPIFKDEENEQEENIVYEVGNSINHKKYGKGTVVKTIKYENRQLLQIEFAQAGKKLLDPKVADIELE